MIYTVTLNPAIDYNMTFRQIKVGEVNRSSGEYIRFGGKGINVSAVLAQLGVRSTALGFIAGATGVELENGVRQMGVDCDFVKLTHGMTRINVKLHSESETELNATGPDIDESALNELLGKTDKLRDGDTVVLAGSVPGSLPRDIYERIAKRLSDRDIRLTVDAEKELLAAWQIDSSDVNLAYSIAAVKMEAFRPFEEDVKPWLDKAWEMIKPDAALMSRLHQQYGLGYYRRQDSWDKAIEHYKEAYKYNPKFISALSTIAYCYEVKKEYRQALQWYEKYLAVAKPGSPGYDFVTKSVAYIKGELFMEEK